MYGIQKRQKTKAGIVVRAKERVWGKEQILLEQMTKERLLSYRSNKTEEQFAIVKKATAGGYKEFRGMKKGKRISPAKKKDNFNNFDGRSYDQEMYMGLIEK